jgi:hypothetical protein
VSAGAVAATAPPSHRRRWVVASALGAAAALSVGVFAATRDDGHTAVPATSPTTTPATTAPGRTSTSVASPNQPSTGTGRRGNQPSTGQTPSQGGSSETPSQGSGQTPSDGSSQLPDQGTSQFPDGSQFPDIGGQLPNLGQLPDLNGQSLDEIIRDILRRLGIDPDTLVPSGSQGGTTNGTSGVN